MEPNPAANAPQLLIVAASARAAAWSAIRAGLKVQCVDLFADRDLARVACVTAAETYPAGLIAAAKSLPGGPWLYGGGFENYPDLVDELAAHRPLAGNCGTVLQAVRNPWRLANVLAAAQLPFAPVLPPGEVPTEAGTWMQKRLHSSGGSAVQIWNPVGVQGQDAAGCYFQRRVEGRPRAGVFLAAAGQTRLLGVTRQMVGTSWCGAQGFQYAGSIGPWPLAPQEEADWQRLGTTLASEFQLQGLFGVDAMVAGGRVTPVEVNPRFPASVEVLERAHDFSAVGWHLAACHSQWLPSATLAAPGRFAGKAILYARQTIVVSATLSDTLLAAAAGSWPTLADIPTSGTVLQPGWPICTVLDVGPTLAEVGRTLRQRCAAVQRLIAAVDGGHDS